MKTYGAKKASELSKKQVGVIFAKAKAGELSVERFVMKDFYDVAGFYGYDSNGSVERSESWIIRIVENALKGENDAAQKLIDVYTETLFNSLSRKNREAADRSIVR